MITLADKFIAWLTLVCGLSLSAVAIYYSVAGLVSIFAAAVVPIIIMGAVLEVSKLVATVWLKQNWFVAPRAIKAYLLAAIFVLMFITSMGIFGYLSKAHMDQNVVSGDVQSKIALYDEKIRTEKENIDASRRALKQMDEAVDQTMSRTDSERGAERAVQIRRQQQAERARLQKDIATAQSNISRLNEERAPIAAEVRKVEAEVGPIKYIAALIYGDNPDQNLLEAAVRWVIIMIVIVFDPLAVILLLASQYSFQWFRDRKLDEDTPDPYVADVGEKPTPEELEDEDDGVREPCPKCGTPMYHAPGIGVYCPNKECDVLDGPLLYKQEQAKKESAPHHPDTHPYLRQGFKYPEGWGTVPPQVYVPDNTEKDEIVNQEFVTNIGKKLDILHKLHETDEKTPEEILDEGLKASKQKWKAENPDDTIKRQEILYDMGAIEQLPWETVEQLDQQKAEEESKKKSSYIIKEENLQIKKTKE